MAAEDEGQDAPLGPKISVQLRLPAPQRRAAAESGITPVEVMLGAMRELWNVGTPEAKRQAAELLRTPPRIFTRLASIDQTIKEDRPFALIPEICSDPEEWEALYRPRLAIEDKTSNE